jgi:hypothetical protein
MFGMFKKKPVPSGPIPFDFEVMIDRPAAEVYPLVDWADPRNSKRQLGHAVEGQSPHFRLAMTSMPDLRITLEVIEERPGEVYEFSCDIQPRVGRLQSSTERYTFEAVNEQQCLLRLVNQATFIDGMTIDQFEQELMTMSIATNDAIMKLKVLAEMGVDAAKSVENATFS